MGFGCNIVGRQQLGAATNDGEEANISQPRDHIRFFLNGRPQVVRGDAAFQTVSEYLRQTLHLCGTKVVCAEGDCGACTVLVGRVEVGRICYRPVDCCIQFVHQIDACHVVSIEGLAQDGELHQAQQAMIDCHGSQCGYCTPGIVMALAGWAEAGADPNKARISLTGNLCRCTGYLPIFAATEKIGNGCSVADRFDTPDLVASLEQWALEPVRIETDGHLYFAPTALEEAVAFRAQVPQAVIVAGATELGVIRNKRGIDPAAVVSLARIDGLDRLVRHDDHLEIGANATWTQIENVVAETIPAYLRIVERFGSPQIRHVATLAGNIANGSPIADSLGLLVVMDAYLNIVGPKVPRRRPINGFYSGYKQKDLASDEIIESVTLPLPESNDRLRFVKVSRRVDLDIATFGSAIRIRENSGHIEFAAIALTGVAATVVRLPRTEAFLLGKPFEEDTFRAAGQMARAEIRPISDVRGLRDFRLQLAENVLVKFYLDETATEGALV
ncbi:MAG: xanthine dehydrogenase small subunit [Gemmataceae bacterium]